MTQETRNKFVFLMTISCACIFKVYTCIEKMTPQTDRHNTAYTITIIKTSGVFFLGGIVSICASYE